MKTTTYTITPFWDKRVMDEQTKMSRVLLTINLNGKQFRISIKLQCTQSEFQSAMNTRSAGAKELRKSIQSYIDKAELILNKLPDPNKDSFVRLFKSESNLFTSTNKTDVFYFFDLKRAEATKEGRISTALNYRDCERSLKNYKSEVYFEDIDEKWLKAYQSYLLNKGNSASTVSIRLRCLRTMFNVAIKQGFIAERHYPFKKFSVGASAKSKSVLYIDQIKQLWQYHPQTLRQERAKAYFFWCYMANGMNFKDMCYIKWRNIKGDVLTFVRQKTKNTSGEVNEIQVHLSDEMKKIIVSYGNADKSPDAFVFPILSKCKGAEHMEKTRFRIKRVTNKSLTEIGKALGFDVHLCLHLARHSFATTLKLGGVNVSYISDMMGHTSMKTTQHYLKSLPTDELKKVSDKLLSF